MAITAIRVLCDFNADWTQVEQVSDLSEISVVSTAVRGIVHRSQCYAVAAPDSNIFFTFPTSITSAVPFSFNPPPVKYPLSVAKPSGLCVIRNTCGAPKIFTFGQTCVKLWEANTTLRPRETHWLNWSLRSCPRHSHTHTHIQHTAEGRSSKTATEAQLNSLFYHEKNVWQQILVITLHTKKRRNG